MYKPIRSTELVEGGNVIKQGEKFTLSFRLFDEDGKEVDAAGKSISVKIASKIGVVYETAATIVGGLIAFSVYEDIGHGDMRVELTVTSGSALLQKYPSDGWIVLRITPSLDDLGTFGVGTITVEKLKNELTQMQNEYGVITDKKLSSMQLQISEVVADGDSSVEAAQARIGSDNTVHASLKDRLDVENNELKTLVEDYMSTDATLIAKGIVKLSNATNSESEKLAATPKAVKEAMDKADAAFTLGNSRKVELVDKLLLIDPSLPITHSSTWQEILSIPVEIDAGVDMASGLQSTGNATLVIRGLSFKPRIIAVRAAGGTGYITYSTVYVNSELLGGLPNISYYFTSSQFQSTVIIYDDGFSISTGVNPPHNWVAVGW